MEAVSQQEQPMHPSHGGVGLLNHLFKEIYQTKCEVRPFKFPLSACSIQRLCIEGLSVDARQHFPPAVTSQRPRLKGDFYPASLKDSLCLHIFPLINVEE
jgi:hypothetical protein